VRHFSRFLRSGLPDSRPVWDSALTPKGNIRISTMSYDLIGNALGDGVYSYTWNAESQMKTGGWPTSQADRV